MTDSEVAALAAAFKTVIEEQGIALRAQIAALRGDLDGEISRAALYREADAASRERMAKMLADAVADAIRPHLIELKRRTGELEREAVFKRMEPVAPAAPHDGVAQ